MTFWGPDFTKNQHKIAPNFGPILEHVFIDFWGPVWGPDFNINQHNTPKKGLHVGVVFWRPPGVRRDHGEGAGGGMFWDSKKEDFGSKLESKQRYFTTSLSERSARASEASSARAA